MPPQQHPRPWRALGIVGVVVVALYAGILISGTHTPQLGLDLQGGTSVTLTPKVTTGGKVTKASLNKAADIISQRVNGLGVAEADVVVEGQNIVVSVPGKGRQEVLALVGRTALLQFRQVLAAGSGAPVTTTTPTPGATRSPAASPTASAKATPSAAGQATQTPTKASRAEQRAPLAPLPKATPSPSPSASQPVDPAVQYATLDCTKAGNREGRVIDAKQSVATCDRTGAVKYLLAPAEVVGTQVKSAEAALDTQTGTQWQVNLTFNAAGTKAFGTLTTRVQPLQSPQNQVAIVLDGIVQSAPQIIQPITDGHAVITGNFKQSEAKDLANILKYGALPLTFQVSTAESISPTLGTSQLHAGLLAGAIGIALVILYCFIYYRLLGVVVVLSLLISGVILYAGTTLLGHVIGYTLTLAGIAGFIVAIGITADSFVVFFERIRDEVREGRTMRSAVERGWVRARRTIISADAVSILAALVLYIVSIGSVRGFAFTLGLSTIVDLVVVFLFTKPLVTIMSNTKALSADSRMSGVSAGSGGQPPGSAVASAGRATTTTASSRRGV